MPSTYKVMLQRMAAKANAKKKQKIEPWFVYILECYDGSFYTGITKNLDKRIKTHNSGKGSTYTKLHRPVVLKYHEKVKGRIAALVREYEIKTFSRRKKEQLVQGILIPKKRLKRKKT